MRSLAIGVLILLAGLFSQAQSLNFSNISQDDLNKVTKEFSANFNHTPISGAGVLGKVFGFEVGVVAGATQSPDIEALVKENDPTASVASIPHAALVAQISVPLGISVDLGYFPEIGSESFRFGTTGFGVKWTFTETLLPLPIDLAVRFGYTTTSLSFTQPVNSSVDATVNYTGTTTSLGFYASKSLVILEPYAGFALITAKGDMSVTGTTIFDPALTADTSASGETSGTQFVVGTNINLLFLKLGVEVGQILGNTKYSGKVAFGF